MAFPRRRERRGEERRVRLNRAFLPFQVFIVAGSWRRANLTGSTSLTHDLAPCTTQVPGLYARIPSCMPSLPFMWLGLNQHQATPPKIAR